MRLLPAVAVIVLAGAGCAPAAPTAPSPTAAPAASTAPAAGAVRTDAVAINGFTFAPAAIVIKADQTVTWTNNAGIAHSIVADDRSFQSESFGKGQSYAKAFATPGIYAYHCGIHPAMKGTVTVE